MNDADLHELLKAAPMPERPAHYWETFPKRVIEQVDSRRRRPASEMARSADIPVRSKHRMPARFGLAISRNAYLGGLAVLGIGLAIICIAVAFVLGRRNGPPSMSGEGQLAEAEKYFREIEALFPNQLQAIVLDQKGARLLLADHSNVPASPPLYLKICGPYGCQRFVTFSGQQIRIDGDTCDVLVDRRGNIIVIGEQFLWAGSLTSARPSLYQIEAKPLQGTS